MPYEIEKMCKRVCEAWYSVALNVLEELYNSMPKGIADLIESKGDVKKYWFYDVGVQCCCVFIRIYFK